MGPFEYVAAIRRRWRLVLACTIAAIAVGWILLPPPTPQATKRGDIYEASVTLINQQGAEQGANVNLVALVTTSGDIPRLAAEKLGYGGDPDALAQTISATADTDAGTVRITASGSSAEQASATAVAFAESALTYLRDSAQRAREASLVASQAQLDEISQRINELDSAIAAAPGPQGELLIEQKAQELERYGEAYAAVRDLAIPSPDTVGLQSVGAPNVTKSGGGIAPPSSLPARLLLFGGLGLALGALVALVVDRMDIRLRNRIQVEEAFNLPVIAEIPRVRRRLSRKSSVLVTSDPGSLVAEAYRSLRSTLMLYAGNSAHEDESEPRSDRRQVLLVTSPLTHDGKTTTVANLAAAFAEAGRSVLVLDCDFRNPEIPDFLDAQPGVGMTEVLAADPVKDLHYLIRPTAISGVSIVASGAVAAHPATLLVKIGALIEAARQHADVVLLDSAPLLSTNDTTDLMQYVDGTLVVCRAGRSTVEQAQRVTSLLARTGVPVFGIAFVAMPGPSRLSAEYRTSGTLLRLPGAGRHLVATAVGDPTSERQANPPARGPAADSGSDPTGALPSDAVGRNGQAPTHDSSSHLKRTRIVGLTEAPPVEGIEWVTPREDRADSGSAGRRDEHDSNGD